MTAEGVQLEDQIERLRELAQAGLERAHAPYSGFRVGAALLGSGGEVAVGCNVENASYGATMCAERNAVGALVASGQRSFELLVLVTEGSSPAAPCGLCRQVLSEFVSDLPVMSFTRSGRSAAWRLASLIPQPFVSDSLQ